MSNTLPLGHRWTTQTLANAWSCSTRTVARIKKKGLLGAPIGKIGKTEIYSDEQKLEAERAGLKHQEEPAQ
jgi:hypothetical protein